MYRLRLKNKGWVPAESVKASVVSNNNINQERFISIPLNWTHIDGRKRDISSGEEVYLDLFRKNSETEYQWCWPRSGNPPAEPALSKLLSEGKSSIKIEFYDDYSLLDYVNIEFDPKGKTLIKQANLS